jgi:chromate transporter
MVVLALAILYANFSQLPAVSNALRGMGAVAAGLIAATGIKLLSALRKHPLGLALSSTLGILVFVAIALMRWPLLYVLLSLGLLSCVLTWRKLKP